MFGRRNFFGAAVGAVAAAMGFTAEPPLRKVWRKSGDGWARCRMYELRAGDVFRMEGEGNELRAASAPTLHPEGDWGIDCTDV